MDPIDEFSQKKKKKSKSVKISDTNEILGTSESAAVHKVEEGEYTKTDDDYTYDQVRCILHVRSGGIYTTRMIR